MTKGELIRHLRKYRNLTQKQLGELCKIAETTIRSYELGRLNPKLETISKIAKALDVSTDDFLFFLASEKSWNEIREIIDFQKEYKKFNQITEDYPCAEEVLSIKDFVHFIPYIDEDDEKTLGKMQNLIFKLNKLGKKVAIERVEELLEIPKYKK